MKKLVRLLVVLVVLLFVIVAIASCAGGSSSSSTPSGFSGTSTPPTSTSAPKPKKTWVDKLTVEQQQVLQSAVNYLTDGQGFSKAGLIDQLSSSSGEGFPRRDVILVVKHVKPNVWYHQAVESAKSYISDGMGFSHDGLIQQLESSSGEGFTHAQAVYAVKKVGL